MADETQNMGILDRAIALGKAKSVPQRTPKLPPAVPSETAIQAKIGAGIRPEWLERTRAIQPALRYVQDARQRVTKMAERVREIAEKNDPQASTLAAASLATAGKNTIQYLSTGPTASALNDEHTAALKALDALSAEKFKTPDPIIGMQIRDSIRSLPQKERVRELRQHLDDLSVCGAILTAPPLASGLTAEEHRGIRLEAERRHIPGIHEVRDIIDRSYGEAMRSATAAVEMVAEMTHLTRRSDGTYRAAWEIDLDD